MKHKEFDRRIKEHLSEYKKSVLRIEESGTHNGMVKNYILPEGIDANFIDDSYLNSNKYDDKNSTNIYSNHLCSSQIMCVNFFLPLMDNKELLKEVMKFILGVDSEKIDITEYDFGHELGFGVKGEVDLYLETFNGEKIYIQSNFIESSFGEFFDNQKTSAWKNTYADFIAKSLYLSDIEKDDFYKEYQMNRNIGLIREENDYVVFIYPFENDSLKEVLENNSMQNVKKVDWNELTYFILKLVKDTELEDYYREFSRKYLNY